MDVYVSIERLFLESSNGSNVNAHTDVTIVSVPPGSGPATTDAIVIVLPTQPALWRQAVVEGIAAHEAQSGNNVIRVMFADGTVDKP